MGCNSVHQDRCVIHTLHQGLRVTTAANETLDSVLKEMSKSW